LLRWLSNNRNCVPVTHLFLFITLVMQKRILLAVASSLCILAAPLIEDTAAGPQLAFRYDGRFQISVFEDLHYGEGEANRMCSND
jgi:hypothetical protein